MGLETLKDYIRLKSNQAIYEYIAENDIDYWYDRAKDDEYDQFLISLCEKYGIELDYAELEKDEIQEEIYEMEDLLTSKLERILFKKEE